MFTAASTLIIPVESQVRELDAKLLLSCVAAERGFPVVLGSRHFVHYRIPFLPQGVYVAKSMRALSERMFNIIRKLGHVIVAWDEESLVHYPAPIYHRRRLSPNTARQISLLFAWGPDDAELFREYPAINGVPIEITGNPRIDLLRPEIRPYFRDDVERLRERFGSFILVNTNYGLVNPFVDGLGLIKRGSANGGGIEVVANADGMTAEYAAGFAAHKHDLFRHFRCLIPVLSQAFPDQTIVIRPHPSEAQGPWQEVARDHPNARVVHEGNVVPWLMAARALVHNGCTTAIEATVLGTPAIAYQPVASDEFDFSLPNSLSHRARSAEDVVAILGRVLTGRLGLIEDAERRRILNRHVASLDGRFAADRMVDALEHAGYAQHRLPQPGKVPYATAWVQAHYRTLSKRLKMYRRNHRNSATYHAHRFPDLSVAELRGRISRLARQLGRFENVDVQPLSAHVFRIARSA